MGRTDTGTWAKAGVAVWIGLLLALTIVTFAAPDRQSVLGYYRLGSAGFWAGTPIYTPATSFGFMYLPTFAVAFTPFELFGERPGEALWRLVSAGLLTWSLWRCARRTAPPGRAFEAFGLALLVAAMGSAAALQNGQSTTLLTAASLLAFEAAWERRPLEAAAWATLALIAKPLAIVAWLLVGATRPRTIPWLILLTGLAIALPYAVRPAPYVNSLYSDFGALMMNISPETNAPWNDFRAPFGVVGLRIAPAAAYAIRALAALATLATVWGLSRAADPYRAVIAAAALACAYMLLFNPRTELNSYVMMAASFGLAAGVLLARGDRRGGLWLAVPCIALGLPELATKTFNPWLDPLVQGVGLGALLFQLNGPRSRQRPPADPYIGPAGETTAPPPTEPA